jgi:hypothetical protein
MRPVNSKDKDKNIVRGLSQAGDMLVRYFHVLNSSNEADWERAFEDTWHAEAIVHGRTFDELKAWHRGLRGKGWVGNVHIVRELDGYQLEYTATVGGRPDGPFLATLRDARIYRVF